MLSRSQGRLALLFVEPDDFVITERLTELLGPARSTLSERLTFGKQPLLWELLGRENASEGEWPVDGESPEHGRAVRPR